METSYPRDFMEALIQHGQGRNSVIKTVLFSYQKVSAHKYITVSLVLCRGGWGRYGCGSYL